MNKVALALGLGLLLFFTYLTAIRPAYAFAYALILLSAVAWVPAPWVEVRDLGQIPDYQPGRVISVGNEVVSWRTRGVYRRRGWMSFGPTSVSVREPFGLFNQELKMGNRTSVLVYPRVRPIPDLMTPSAQQIGSSQSLGAWAEYPPDTGGVRDYTPGDSFGRIHWPLSTRHGRLMSKTFEQPLTTDLWILLDLDRGVHYGEGEESTVEYAVSLAASMASQVHSRGRQVGLIANDSKGTILEPRRAIAVITPSADEEWVRLLQAVRGRRTTLIVFYLDVASFGGPDQNPTFDLGQDVDLYVVRKSDDFARLVRTRDAIRIA